MCYNVTDEEQIMELRKMTQNKNNESASSNENYKKDKETNNAKEAIKELKKSKAKNIHAGHRARLKTQFLENQLDSMTDIQKLELLLFFAIPQKDTNPIAHNLLDAFGSIKEVFDADFSQLINVDGVKENSALLINLVKSFTKYCYKPNYLGKVDSTKAAMDYASKLLYGASTEEFYLLCLTFRGDIIKYYSIGKGTIDKINIEIRTLTQIAIENKVNRIMICHNHPHGKAEMSDEDLSFTYSVMCSCLLNSIDLVDHVIIGTDGALSLSEGHVIERLKKKAIDSTQISRDIQMFLSASQKEYKISKHVHIDYKCDF